MRRRFVKNIAVAVALSVAVSMCSVTAFAGESAGAGDTEQKTNSDNIPSTNENLDENTDSGIIKENDHEITTNNGKIETNDGTVKTNNKEIETNNGTVETNNGNIGTNNRQDTEQDTEQNAGIVEKNKGGITTNKGVVTENSSSGSIDKNIENGVVYTNYGGITENSAKPAETTDPSYNVNVGVVNNLGNISTNSGYVRTNGKDPYQVNSNITDEQDQEPALIEESSEGSHAKIYINQGTVIGNFSEISNNANSGYVGTNGYVQFDDTTEKESPDPDAVVKNNTGIVNMNNGVVENMPGGKVGHNNGIVYNYGGEITGKRYDASGKVSDGDGIGPGTEYFSVSVETENGKISYGDGFKDYDKNKWLGVEYTSVGENRYKGNSSSSTVTVTPNSGYQISELNIPEEYKGYISAKKNSDGSWTLNVTSGYNIKLFSSASLIEVPTADKTVTEKNNQEGSKAVTIDISVSSDSDRDDDGGPVNSPARPGTGILEQQAQNGMMPQFTVETFDFMGQGLSMAVSDVLKPVDNITAMNNFSEMGAQLPSGGNMMACGVVDFQNAFVNSATGSVDVPVSANVIAGQTYTVALSDGTTLQVICAANGVLNIPFAANAQNLTFIIYGMQMNPAMMMLGE